MVKFKFLSFRMVGTSSAFLCYQFSNTECCQYMHEYKCVQASEYSVLSTSTSVSVSGCEYNYHKYTFLLISTKFCGCSVINFKTLQVFSSSTNPFSLMRMSTR